LIDDKEINKQIKLAQEQAAAFAKRAEKLEGTVLTIESMIKDGKLITQDRFEAEVNKKADGLANAVLDVWEKQRAYEKEFGKDLPRQVLIDEAAKHQGSIELAYESLSKKDREEKFQKDTDAKYQKIYEDKIRAAGLPIDGGPSPANDLMGPLQQKFLGIKTDIPDDVPADGSGRLGYLIGQELVKEGKAK
jgi:hypothetical protein